MLNVLSFSKSTLKSVFILLFLFAGFFSATLYASDSSTYWAKTYGSNYDSEPNFIIQTNDGGYVLGGAIGISGGHNAWIAKLDSFGDVVWQKAYDGGNKKNDYAKSILQKDDGNLMVLGNGDRYFWLLELDGADGSIKFQKSYQASYEPSKTSFDMNSIIKTDDGGYILIGSEFGYHAPLETIIGVKPMHWVLAIRVAADGSVNWARNIRNIAHGGVGYQPPKWGKLYANDAFETQDGGFLVVGSAVGIGKGFYGSDHHHLMLLKLYSNGKQEWLKTYGGIRIEDGYAGVQLDDGNYLVGGRGTISSYGGITMWAMKINTDGSIIWQKTYGKNSSSEIYDIKKTNDGEILIVGKGKSSLDSSRYNILALKLDEQNGDVKMGKELGSTTNGDSKGLSVIKTDDGGYVIAGVTNSFGGSGESNDDIWVLKLDNLLYTPFDPSTSTAYLNTLDIKYTNTKTGKGSVTTDITNEQPVIKTNELNATDTDVTVSSQGI